MAASFLQFCATCEEQITIPNNSILYCSERCRRRDSLKPLSISVATTAAISLSRISTPEPELSPVSPRAIVPPRMPTKASSSTTSLEWMSGDDGKSDLEFGDWKPKQRSRSHCAVASSAAFQYLSQFQRSSSCGPDCKSESHIFQLRRAPVTRRSTSNLSNYLPLLGTAPSLAYSPTASTSSLSSLADLGPYSACTSDFATRPLPPRHNPSFSTSACGTRDLELVIPFVADTTCTHPLTEANLQKCATGGPAVVGID